MSALLAIIKKDCLLLWRDKMGLLILFLMPMALVLFMSLVQADLDGKSVSMNIGLIQSHSDTASKKITKAIEQNDFFNVTRFKLKSLNDVKRKVASGKLQALIILPAKVKRNLGKRKMQVQLFLDPNLPADKVKIVKVALSYILQTLQLKLTQKKLHAAAPRLAIKKDWFAISTQFPGMASQPVHPNSVQQNVPAWTLFGMFFIVIPLAGQIVRERNDGIYWRLHLAPVSELLLFFGKSMSFLLLNLFQLFLMLNVGLFILPQFGLPALNLSGHWLSVLSIGFFASLAAIGFGLLIGRYAKSYQQATSAGPFVIVITAALSGIFVPSFIMPSALRHVSEFSPMFWAQSAFLDVLVRSSDLQQLFPYFIKLFGFFLLMLGLSVLPSVSKSFR